MMNPISYDVFWKIYFKHSEVKQRILSMEALSNETFFKLVLMFLK